MAEEIATAQAAIDELTRVFFGAFSNMQGAGPNIDVLYRLFISQAVITKRSGEACEIYDLRGFIEPRRQLLTAGRLVGFEEQEVSARTEIFGGIAQRFCTYRKTGFLDGRAFAGRGVKTIQFIQADGNWKISALAWEDEPVPSGAGT